MSKKRTHIQPGQKLELDLTPAERRAILDQLTLLPPEYEALLKKVHPEQPLLLTLDELEDFSGYVAAEANHTKNEKLGAVLDSAYEKMAELLDTFTDQGTPAKKRRKRVLELERDEAELHRNIAEHSAVIATWAAGVLQSADRQGTTNRVLESFSPGKLEQAVLTTMDDVSPAVRKRLKSGKKDFTLAEVDGMLMAVAGELCVAPLPKQVGLLLVAKALMGAMQDGVNDVKEGQTGKSSRAKASAARQAKKPRGTQQTKKKPGQ
jgi:hypothetical protein